MSMHAHAVGIVTRLINDEPEEEEKEEYAYLAFSDVSSPELREYLGFKTKSPRVHYAELDAEDGPVSPNLHVPSKLDTIEGTSQQQPFQLSV